MKKNSQKSLSNLPKGLPADMLERAYSTYLKYMFRKVYLAVYVYII